MNLSNTPNNQTTLLNTMHLKDYKPGANSSISGTEKMNMRNLNPAATSSSRQQRILGPINQESTYSRREEDISVGGGSSKSKPKTREEGKSERPLSSGLHSTKTAVQANNGVTPQETDYIDGKRDDEEHKIIDDTQQTFDRNPSTQPTFMSTAHQKMMNRSSDLDIVNEDTL